MKIGVIMGGISSEREISLRTGKAVVEALKNTEYNVIEVVIDKKEDIFNIPELDFALLALHGKYGEDGMVQNLLEMKDIPYSGCDAVTSAMCMDKNITKHLLRSAGIPTANWMTVKDGYCFNGRDDFKLNFPVFVKPNSGGSSVATFKVECFEDLSKSIDEALKWDIEVMIEEFVHGSEITCAMLDRQVLPIMQIDAKGEFFDFQSKYKSNGADEYEVDFELGIREKINQICYDTWDVLGCDVYARVDIIKNGDDMNVLEVNTLPGMTETSLFPKSANAFGLSMSDLLVKIIELSVDARAKVKRKREFVEAMNNSL